MDKIQDTLGKLFGKRSVPIIVFVVICIGLYMYSSSKYYVVDKMTDLSSGAVATNVNSAPIAPVAPAGPSGYDTKDTASPNDLLPKDMNSEWSRLNPVGSNNVVGSDLLDSKAFMGQISQYKGIMNYDIRAFPVIEKREVSPWLQSTFEPDINRTGIQLTN